jgi:hypothetical protein
LDDQLTTADHVEITDPDKLRSWLTGKPTEWAVDIAVRAALRVIPLTLAAGTAKAAGNLRLQALRAAFIAWTTGMRGDYAQAKPDDDARADTDATAAYAATTAAYAACSDAARTVGVAEATAAYATTATAAAAAVAHAAAVNARAAVARAAATADAAADAAIADTADAAHRATIWQSIAADARWLGSSRKPGRLIEQPLWLGDVPGAPDAKTIVPPRLREALDTFDRNPLVTEGPWGVWLAWYRAILPDAPGAKPRSFFGEPKDIEIARLDDTFWRRDPDGVTAQIAEIVGWRYEMPDAPTKGSSRPPSQKKRPSRSKDTEKLPLESVEPQSDEPTTDDQLGRKIFAQTLVERMDRMHETRGDNDFAIHLHAPWGAGKTSVLLMMRELMTASSRKTIDGRPAPR